MAQIPLNSLDWLADPNTDLVLLPSSLAPRDNARRLRHCKTALRQGLRICLTPSQRTLIRMHYTDGLRKSEIARLRNSTCSAVSKSIKAGEQALREYVSLYMTIYDRLERELLSEE